MNLSRRLDPRNWRINVAGLVVLALIILYALETQLGVDLWIQRATLWLGFPTGLIIIGRTNGLRFRDLAPLVVPTTVVLVVSDLALDGLAWQLARLAAVLGAVAVLFVPRFLHAWANIVAPGYYRWMDDPMATGPDKRHP